MPPSTRNRSRARRRQVSLGWRAVLFSLLLNLILGAVVAVPLFPLAADPDVSVDRPAPYDIISPVATRFVSSILTQEDQDAAAAAVPDVYRFDSNVTVQERRVLSDTMRVVEAIVFNPEYESAERLERLLALEEVHFTSETLTLLFSLQEREWKFLKEEALRLYDEVTHDPLNPENVLEIDADDVEEIRGNLTRQARPTFSLLKRTLIAQLVAPFLSPNFVVDEEETERRREEARRNTPPHYVDIQEGQLLLIEGQIVHEEDLEKLEAAGLRSREIKWPEVVGPIALVVGLVSSYGAFLYRFHEDVFRRIRTLLLLGMIIVVTAIAAKFLVTGRFGFAYAFPLPTASILIALLLNPSVALSGTIVLAVFVGLVGGGSLELTVLGIAGGLIGLLGIWKAQRSSAFLFTGFYVAVVNLIVVGAFRLIALDLEPEILRTAAIACAINGFFSAALSFASFGFLGTLFGQVTVLQLMELTNPNHPLLRRLMQEAPGTYYHSIVVGNLAERAAEVIGADPLLARVGAYYHDVGKVIRPYFFIDNQSGRSNIHDDLAPRTSAQLITDHVRDGITLARKYRLPEQIVEFIPQHHGTTMATFFYRRALQSDETVNPDDFRYPGPKPQTRETAILMLADSVEATVRAMDQSGKLQELLESSEEGDDPLGKLVAEIIDKRVRDGQLDECGLTFQEVSAVRDAFVEMLRGVYHRRVAYPELAGSKEAAP